MLLIANKGWQPEQKLTAFHDYFMSRKFYNDFNNFIRKMR